MRCEFCGGPAQDTTVSVTTLNEHVEVTKIDQWNACPACAVQIHLNVQLLTKPDEDRSPA